jgi:hypothetical protein
VPRGSSSSLPSRWEPAFPTFSECFSARFLCSCCFSPLPGGATKNDLQMFRFLLYSGRTRTHYDPMKFAPLREWRLRHV